VDTNKLSAADVCSIIETCNRAGVSEIAIGDMKVVFSNGVAKPSSWLALPTGVTKPVEEPDVDELEMTDADRRTIDDAMQAHMMLEDPLAYEDSIIDGAMAEMGLTDKEDNA